jgi:hypothetical protein
VHQHMQEHLQWRTVLLHLRLVVCAQAQFSFSWEAANKDNGKVMTGATST